MWFGPKDEKDSQGDKDKKNENLDEYSDDDNENKEEEDLSLIHIWMGDQETDAPLW